MRGYWCLGRTLEIQQQKSGLGTVVSRFRWDELYRKLLPGRHQLKNAVKILVQNQSTEHLQASTLRRRLLDLEPSILQKRWAVRMAVCAEEASSEAYSLFHGFHACHVDVRHCGYTSNIPRRTDRVA